jgi:hypothetical protein
MGGANGLTICDCCVELRSIGDGVPIIDRVGHPDREWGDSCDKVIDLACGVARVEQNQKRRVVGRLERQCECPGSYNNPLVHLVLLILEDDQVIVAVPGEVHHVGSESGDAIEKIIGRRCGANIEVHKVAVQCTLDGRADALLLSPNPQPSV